MDNYNLGIMWSIGTLVKGINRYTIQTSDADKLYYMDKLAAEHNKEIKKSIRHSRGKETEIYTLSFSDSNYAYMLRSMGYDDPNVAIPDNTDDSFMAAFLELNIKSYLNNGNIFYRINYYDCTGINKFFAKIGISEKKITHLDGVDCISFGKEDMIVLSKHIIFTENSNVIFWKHKYNESILVNKKGV